jgi:hypothetical protein
MALTGLHGWSKAGLLHVRDLLEDHEDGVQSLSFPTCDPR